MEADVDDRGDDFMGAWSVSEYCHRLKRSGYWSAVTKNKRAHPIRESANFRPGSVSKAIIAAERRRTLTSC